LGSDQPGSQKGSGHGRPLKRIKQCVHALLTGARVLAFRIRWSPDVAFEAIKNLPNGPSAPDFRYDPRPVDPGRIVPSVLVMPAFEAGSPMRLRILMEAQNPTLHFPWRLTPSLRARPRRRRGRRPLKHLLGGADKNDAVF